MVRLCLINTTSRARWLQVSTLGSNDPNSYRSQATDVVQMDNGDIIYDLRAELGGVPANSNNITVNVTASEIMSSDSERGPLSDSPWASAGYVQHRGPGDHPFRSSAVLTLKLYKPPYVFCTWTLHSQNLTSRPLFFKMACKQNLDVRCVLVPAPWVLGPKHVSNPE